MRRIVIFVMLMLFSALCFAQQNSNIRIIGIVPSAEDERKYQIQVGAFKHIQNAETVFKRLQSVLLNPAYESYWDLTRVVINGVSARDVPSYLQKIQYSGFTEVIIRIDTNCPEEAPPPIKPVEEPVRPVRPVAAPVKPVEEPVKPPEPVVEQPVVEWQPVIPAEVPSTTSTEIAYRIIRIREVLNLAEIVKGKNVLSWESSAPSVASVDSNGRTTGRNIGSAIIKINPNEYISVAVVPQQDLYVVPEAQMLSLPPPEKNSGRDKIDSMPDYKTEPTLRLAYIFNNKGKKKRGTGKYGIGGIDIIARGENYKWLKTTFGQGGWFYDLNGVKREMTNGFQKDYNVELTVKPEFIYDKGITYLQLTHRLYNPNLFPVTGQRFGASADVMISQNDSADLIHTEYGAKMTDNPKKPKIELMFVCETGEGITPVDTLWLGTYDNKRHLDYIYEDRRQDVHGQDSAIGFSYQNIDLDPGETKEFVVRFTLAMKEQDIEKEEKKRQPRANRRKTDV